LQVKFFQYAVLFTISPPEASRSLMEICCPRSLSIRDLLVGCCAQLEKKKFSLKTPQQLRCKADRKKQQLRSFSLA
jgi:hypothetical protein